MTDPNRCHICKAFLLIRHDPEVSAIMARSLCACHVTGRCSVPGCGVWPAVQEVLDPTRETDIADPDLRCRAHVIELIDPVVNQPGTKAPDGPLEETILQGLKLDPHTFECVGCGHHYKGDKAVLEKTLRGWVIACPKCHVTELSVYVAREKKTRKK